LIADYQQVSESRTDCPTDLFNWLIVWMIGWLFDHLISDWLTDWLIDTLINWLIDWLITTRWLTLPWSPWMWKRRRQAPWSCTQGPSLSAPSWMSETLTLRRIRCVGIPAQSITQSVNRLISQSVISIDQSLN